MEYRATTPADNGFGDEADELMAMREFIQTMMHKSGPVDLLDSLLITANICDSRATLYGHHPAMYAWYVRTGAVIRAALNLLAQKDDFCPQYKLENPMLYYPDVEHIH